MAQRVTVYRTFDPGLADMLAGMLAQDGIEAQVRGARGSSVFGAGQLILATMVDVPTANEAEARALVEAILSQSSDLAAAAAEAEHEEDAPVPGRGRGPLTPGIDKPAPISLLRALGVAPLVPGGAHLVARRYVTGLCLLTAQCLALAAFARGGALGEAGWMVFVGLLLVDLVGGGLAVRAHNRGGRSGRFRQLLTAITAIAGVGLLANLAAPEVWRHRNEDRRVGDDDGPTLRNGFRGADGALPPILRTSLTEGFR